MARLFIILLMCVFFLCVNLPAKSLPEHGEPKHLFIGWLWSYKKRMREQEQQRFALIFCRLNVIHRFCRPFDGQTNWNCHQNSHNIHTHTLKIVCSHFYLFLCVKFPFQSTWNVISFFCIQFFSVGKSFFCDSSHNLTRLPICIIVYRMNGFFIDFVMNSNIQWLFKCFEMEKSNWICVCFCVRMKHFFSDFGDTIWIS